MIILRVIRFSCNSFFVYNLKTLGYIEIGDKNDKIFTAF